GCGEAARAFRAVRARGARPRPPCGGRIAVRTRSRLGAIRPPRRSPTSAQPPTSPAPYMAWKVVLVQPVHDQDARTRQPVVQSAVERVVVPLVGRLPLGLRQRFLGFQRSSMTIM